jgi:hypothetical protein
MTGIDARNSSPARAATAITSFTMSDRGALFIVEDASAM